MLSLNPVKVARNFSDFIHALNGITVTGGHLGIPRGQMPQVDSQYLTQFLAYLGQNGITTKKLTIPAMKIRLAQTEYNKMKVLKLMQLYRDKPSEKLKPIIVSADGYVMDGSHRFLAQYNIDPHSQVKVIQTSADIKQLLPIARKAGGVRFRNVSDRTLSK